MSQYTINLTETQELALSYATLNTNDWLTNFVNERARVATEEIVKVAIEKCFENSISVPSTKDELVSLAFEQGWVETAQEKLDRALQSS